MKYDDAGWHSGGEFPPDSPDEFGGTRIALMHKGCFLKGWAGAVKAVRSPAWIRHSSNRSRVARNTPRFGKLQPRYRFALNPFPEVRWSRCPRCDKLTHYRKFPLLIHIDGLGLLTLGKTCRYCTPCEFIIADQLELEEQLVIACEERGYPEKVGSEYTVFATVERAWWKESLKHHQLSVEDLRAHAADMKEHHRLSDPRRVWTSAEK